MQDTILFVLIIDIVYLLFAVYIFMELNSITDNYESIRLRALNDLTTEATWLKNQD